MRRGPSDGSAVEMGGCGGPAEDDDEEEDCEGEADDEEDDVLD